MRYKDLMALKVGDSVVLMRPHHPDQNLRPAFEVVLTEPPLTLKEGTDNRVRINNLWVVTPEDTFWDWFPKRIFASAPSDYEKSVCMNCGKDEHTEAELRACVESILGPPRQAE